jgi:hypothetical protein
MNEVDRPSLVFIDFNIPAFTSGRHRNSRTFPIESFVHDSGAPWYVPNTVIPRDLQIPAVKEEICRYSSQYSA